MKSPPPTASVASRIFTRISSYQPAVRRPLTECKRHPKRVEGALVLLRESRPCDDTATAVVRDGCDTLLASVSTNQDAFHAKYGGIVPEIAGRQHVALLSAAVDDALGRANMSLSDLAGIAVTRGPGLIGSLVVGVAAASPCLRNEQTASMPSITCTASSLPRFSIAPSCRHIHSSRCLFRADTCSSSLSQA